MVYATPQPIDACDDIDSKKNSSKHRKDYGLDEFLSCYERRVGLFGLFSFFHVTLYIEPAHLHNGIGAQGDSLLEMSRKFSLAIVGHFDRTFLAWFDGSFGISRDGASA